MPLSLEEQLETTTAVTQFSRLYALDRLWTDYLQQRTEPPIPEQDVQVLEKLANEMDTLLQEAPNRATYLVNTLIAAHNEELQESYERIFWGDGLTGDQKMRLRDIVNNGGGIGEYSTTTAVSIQGTAPSERQVLTDKMATIRRGNFAAGDLSTAFICGLAGGCITGGLFAPPPMNFIGVGIGLTVIGGVFASGERC
jgi:hypothetical protein